MKRTYAEERFEHGQVVIIARTNPDAKHSEFSLHGKGTRTQEWHGSLKELRDLDEALSQLLASLENP